MVLATFFVVSDVHSFYDELMFSLKEQGFNINNDSHIFVSLGDLLDRGTQPKECLDFVNSLPDSRKILIKGNHEYLLEECIRNKIFRSHDYHNKTIDTALILTNSITCTDSNIILTKLEHNQDWIKYINSCINYYENSKYVFVHGWIPCTRWVEGINLFGDEVCNYDPLPDWRFGNWEKACWLNGMECWSKSITVPNKTIICGHYHSAWGHCFLHNQGINIPTKEEDISNWITDPFIDEGIMAIDACTVLSRKVNCIKLSRQPKKEN